MKGLYRRSVQGKIKIQNRSLEEATQICLIQKRRAFPESFFFTDFCLMQSEDYIAWIQKIQLFATIAYLISPENLILRVERSL